MFIKASLLGVIAFLQVNVVLSQQQQFYQPKPQSGTGFPYQQQQAIQGMTQAQMYDPYSWATPYYAAATNVWTDYLKKAQEASAQLYKQWDKTGAADLLNIGAAFAQQAATQAQQMAQLAAAQAAKKPGGF